MWKDGQKRKKILTKFFIGYGAQRRLKSCSITENSIEWNIKWKEETFHAFLIHSLSQKVLLSNQIAVFIDQLVIFKDHCISFFLYMLRDTQMRKMLKKNRILELAGIGVK